MKALLFRPPTEATSRSRPHNERHHLRRAGGGVIARPNFPVKVGLPKTQILTWSDPINIAEKGRVQLGFLLEDLRPAKTPIDNRRIEQALIAPIETVLEPGAPGADADSQARSTGFHGA
jgi:hypothetical protein